MHTSTKIVIILAVGAVAFYFYSKPSFGPGPSWPDNSIIPVIPDFKPEPNEPLVPLVAESYEEARKLSDVANRPILVYFHKANCPYCTKMEEEVLPDEEVQRAIGDFVFYTSDSTAERPLADKFGVKGLPSYRVITTNEQVLNEEAGYMPKDEFLKWLQGDFAMATSPLD